MVNHGAQLARYGVDPASLTADREAIKASFGIVDPDMEVVTYEEDDNADASNSSADLYNVELEETASQVMNPKLESVCPVQVCWK